jgi:glycosyltransferase involved in cell wall biosynthesis
MARPFFSVLLPAYNARDHIQNAVRDILRQTWTDFELLVVDDGSSDGTADLVREFQDSRLRLLRLEKNQGLVAALNHGLAEAAGRWIARQDADDRSRRDRLQKQAALIEKNPEAVLVYSHARLIDAHGYWRGRLRSPVDDAGLRWDLCFRNSVPHTSAVFPLELARDRLQGYCNFKACEDYDLWSRLLGHGKAVGSPEPLVSYRNHAQSIMGQEHSVGAERVNESLQGILRTNLREWLGASDEEVETIVRAWLDSAAVDWSGYFRMTDKLASGSLRPSSRLLAEQDFTLLNRAANVSKDCARRMLDALGKNSPQRFSSLPAIRTFLTRLLRGG